MTNEIARQLLRHYQALQADNMDVPKPPRGLQRFWAEDELVERGYVERKQDGLLYLTPKGAKWSDDGDR